MIYLQGQKDQASTQAMANAVAKVEALKRRYCREEVHQCAAELAAAKKAASQKPPDFDSSGAVRLAYPVREPKSGGHGSLGTEGWGARGEKEAL